MSKRTKQVKMDLSAPVPDSGRKAQDDPKRKARTAKPLDTGDRNSAPRGEDRVWDVSSRARWPDNRDAITKPSEDTADAGGEEEEEEGSPGSKLTKSQLKAALDEKSVEYSASASKAELVELYDANIQG